MNVLYLHFTIMHIFSSAINICDGKDDPIFDISIFPDNKVNLAGTFKWSKFNINSNFQK